MQRPVAAAGAAMVNDPVVLARMAPGMGIPMPRSHAVLCRLGSGWSWHTGRAVGPHQWAETLDDLPDRIVVRPAEGRGGVCVLTRVSPGLWRKPDHRFICTEVLVDRLRQRLDVSAWLCEEHIVDHPRLAALGASGALSLVRVASLVQRDGHPEVMWATLRLGADDAAVGRVTGWVDVPTGVVTRALWQRFDTLGLKEVTQHPVTGDPLLGVTVPMWQRLCALSRRVAVSVLPLRSLGQDIAVTADGPVLIRTSAACDPPAGFPTRPAMDSLHEAAGMPGVGVSPQHPAHSGAAGWSFGW